MHQTISMNTGDITLEGVFNPISADRAVVVTHPHPLYGGDMHNGVVTTIAQVYADLGWSTLRFNFRGVGNSRGTHDHGGGERDDLQAAVDFIVSRGIAQIDLAGYSFGAWIIGRWARDRDTRNRRIILISPPVAFIDFSDVGPIGGLHGVITGDGDDIAPEAMIRAELPRWHPQARLQVLAHTDHFYNSRLNDLAAVLHDLIA